MSGVKIEPLNVQIVGAGGGNAFDLWEDDFSYANVTDMMSFYEIQSATSLAPSIAAGVFTITQSGAVIAFEAKSFMTPASLPGAINQEQFTEAVFRGVTGGANARHGWLVCGRNDGRLMQNNGGVPGALNGNSQGWCLLVVPGSNLLLRRLVNGVPTTIATMAMPAVNDKVTLTVEDEAGDARLKTFFNDVLQDSTLDAAGTVAIAGLPGLYLQESAGNNPMSWSNLRCGALTRLAG